MRPGRLRAVRWTELAIVFQGALHTLNPVQRIGRQIGEAIRLHSPDMRGGKVSARVGELLELVGLPARRAQRLPAPALRRPAPARAHRARARVRAAAADRRRADDGARRHGPGAGPAAARGPPAAPRAGGRLHHARPVDARRGVPADRRHVCRADRRGGAEPPGLRGARAPYTRALAAAFPIIGDPAFRMAPSGLAGDPPDPRELPSGCPFRPRCARCGRGVRVRRRRAVAGRRRAPRRLRARPGLGSADPEPPGGQRPARRVPRPPARSPVRSTASTSRCAPARSSPWWASRAAARRRSRATIVGLQRPASGRCRCAASRCATSRRALRAHRREVQMVFQDPTGALNARQTIYEAVAEGVRIQGVPGNEEQLVARGALARRPAPARALLRPLPLRDLRRPAPARDHRRGDGARAEPARGRRAGVEPRRLGARRDPRSDAAPGARDRGGDPRRHPRPRAGVERRRPRGRHVPGADRRAGHDRGGAHRAAPSLHARAAVGRAGGRPCRAADPERRGARPDADPVRLSLPPALPAGGLRRGRAAGHRGALPRRGPGARAGARRARPARRRATRWPAPPVPA